MALQYGNKHLYFSEYYERCICTEIIRSVVLSTKPTTGFRHYPDETVARIRFIKQAQELGFTLEEVANLLSLNDQPCNQVQGLAERKLSSVKEKMVNLHRLENVLQSLLAQCHSNDDESRCPIIHSLQP